MNEITMNETEVEIRAIRSRGAGGQNVNKVSTAIQLRFDINLSSLPGSVKERLLKMNDSRITKEGIIIIKSQEYRSREKNRAVALTRLAELIKKASVRRRKRVATKPSKKAMARRLDTKKRRSNIKTLRGNVKDD
ncbi:MAG: alternative ribosome rescue aminoacyl-tRNA hydrolase ArfB [Deltaproteobacteria bacterium]|nr:alternative ribosome rescue aminoacyl-tRNA hydrolase ArfB [Deltaproteobacteria bacterium]